MSYVMVISTEDFQVGGTSTRKRDLFMVNLQRFIHSLRTLKSSSGIVAVNVLKL